MEEIIDCRHDPLLDRIPAESVLDGGKLISLDNFADIFEPFAGEEEPGSQVFFTRPGAGKAFYCDMFRPRRSAKEVNCILNAVPLVEQNHLEYKGPYIEIEMTQGRVIVKMG